MGAPVTAQFKNGELQNRVTEGIVVNLLVQNIRADASKYQS